jgi:hypothetical protein
MSNGSYVDSTFFIVLLIYEDLLFTYNVQCTYIGNFLLLEIAAYVQIGSS